MKRGSSLLAHWFGFAGRLGRGDYNGVNLVALVLLFAANIVFVSPLFYTYIAPPITLSSIPLGLNAWVAAALVIPAIWIAVSSTVRRLHDLGWSGWWLVLCLAPQMAIALFAGVIGLIVLAFMRGTRGPNEYGDRTPPNQLV